MFKNLHLKIFALFLATIFWIFVVSLENAFFQFPGEVLIQVFNQSSDLALASVLGGVKLTLRSQDPAVLRNLSPNDFEVYVDLRNSGAGTRRTSISVTSKNPQVSVLRVDPAEVDVTLEPLREKNVPIVAQVIGQPAKGFRMNSVKLSSESVNVSGAESVLKKIRTINAVVTLQGSEEGTTTKPVLLQVLDGNGVPLDGVQIEKNDIDAVLDIVQVATTKEVGIKPQFVGALSNGTIAKVEVTPSVVTVTGPRDALDQITVLETEPIDLKDVTANFEKSEKLVLPAGVSLEPGQNQEVKVAVEIAQKQ